MTEQFTRRRLLQVGAAGAATFGSVQTVAASAGSDGESAADGSAADEPTFERIPMREFDDRALRTDVVSPAAVPERATGVRPGSQMFVHFPDGTTAGCSANFVWQDADGDSYVGAAGHCFLPEDANASKNAQREEEDDDDVYDVNQLAVSVCTDCTFGGLTGLNVEGSVVELGEVAYARQQLPDGSAVGHDFGLARIPSDVEDLVGPSLPQWGGPDGTLAGAAPEGTPVNQYGAGVGNGEVFATQGSTGVSLGDGGSAESWFAAIRASPGDSGSPLVATDTDDQPSTGGPAAGILTHLSTFGVAGTTIGRCKELHRTDGLDLELSVVQPDGS